MSAPKVERWCQEDFQFVLDEFLEVSEAAAKRGVSRWVRRAALIMALEVDTWEAIMSGFSEAEILEFDQEAWVRARADRRAITG